MLLRQVLPTEQWPLYNLRAFCLSLLRCVVHRSAFNLFPQIDPIFLCFPSALMPFYFILDSDV
jgi:hypothetical protein